MLTHYRMFGLRVRDGLRCFELADCRRFGLKGIRGFWVRGLVKRGIHLSDIGPADLPRTKRSTHQSKVEVY